MQEKAHGDLATNLAMLLAKPARKNPRELAAAIIEHLPASDLIAKVEIAGPGFINFFFDPSWLAGQVEAMVASANANVKLPAPQTVVVDYSAPNVAKEMAVHPSVPPYSVTWPPVRWVPRPQGGACQPHRRLGYPVRHADRLSGRWPTSTPPTWNCAIWKPSTPGQAPLRRRRSLRRARAQLRGQAAGRR